MNRKNPFFYFFLLFSLPFFGQETGSGIEVFDLDNAVVDSSEGIFRVDIPEGDFSHGSISERLLFSLSYSEGAPSILFSSPLGETYDIFDERIEFQFWENGIIGSVIKPEPGQWIIRVQNAPGLNSYQLTLANNPARPEVVLEPPIRISNNLWRIQGQVYPARAGVADIRLGPEQDSLAGKTLETTEVGSDGQFFLNFDTNDLLEGTYYPSTMVSLDDGVTFLSGYSGQSIVVEYEEDLEPIHNWSAEINHEGVLRARWENDYGLRVRGYSFDILDKDSGYTTTQFLGYKTEIEMAGFSNQNGYDITLLTIPEGQGDALQGSTLSLIQGTIEAQSNVPVIHNIPNEVTLKVGEEVEFFLELDVSQWEATNSVRDWVTIEWDEIPEGLYIHKSYEGYQPLETEGKISFEVTVNDTIAPGDYLLSGSVQNMGTGAYVDYEWEIWIRYPDLVVERVSDPQVLINQSGRQEVYGDHFFANTSVFWKGSEIPILEIFPDRITLEMEYGSEPGDFPLVLENYHGQRDEVFITIEDPGYILTAYKSRTQVQAGSSTTFWWDFEAKEGFSEDLTFSLQNLPTGWGENFNNRVLQDGELGVLTLTVPENTPLGPYNVLLRDEQGYGFDLIVEVTDTQPDPFISGFYPYGVYEGESVQLLGYGFGEQPETIIFGNQELEIISWDRETIEVVIPWETKPGPIHVALEGSESNHPFFPVKNYGFSLVLQDSQVDVEPGDVHSIPVAVIGYGAQVDLRADWIPDIFEVSWSEPSVVPNAVPQLDLTVSPLAKNGRHQFTIFGESGPYRDAVELNIKVGNAFEMMTHSFPLATQGARYSYPIQYVHNKGDLTSFTVTDGSMPEGMSLNANGTLEGIPSETGVFQLTIQAIDGIGQVDEKSFSLEVEESMWPSDDGDFGRTRFMPIDSSAELQERWIIPGLHGEDLFLAGSDLIYASARNAVVGIDEETGEVLFQTPGRVQSLAYSSGVLVALEYDGTLKALNPYTGKVLWSREGYESMHLAGDRVFAKTAAVFQEIQLATGILKVIHNADFPQQILVMGEQLVSWSERTIRKWNGMDWESLWTKGEAIVNLSADAQGLLVLSSDDTITLIDWDGTKLSSIPLDQGFSDLSLGMDHILVWNARDLMIFDRISLESMAQWSGDGINEVAQSAKKIIVSDNAGVHVINPWVANDIWLDPAGAKGLVLFQGLLGYQRNDGSFLLVEGSKNIETPVTEFYTIPNQPLGDNNYYDSPTFMNLQATDHESYPVWSKYQIGNGELLEYDQQVLLPEGSYTIAVFSQDSHGLDEAMQFYYVNIDNSDPVTMAIFDAESGAEDNIYLEEILISIEASDQHSGVEQTQYRWNNGNWLDYHRPFRFGTGGWHVLGVKSQDKAGRWESERTYRILIDKEDPWISAHQVTRGSLTFLHINAGDAHSEVERIEFRLNGGETQYYSGPQVFSEPGEYLLQYRALDTAGNVTRWFQDEILVTAEQGLSLIENLNFYDGRAPKDPVLFAGGGASLFTFALPEYNTVTDVPEEFIGGVQIMMSERDGFIGRLDFLNFRVSEDAEVHIVVPTDSPVRWDDWEERGRLDLVEPYHYFEDSGIWYSRLYAAGETVEIPGPALGRAGGYLLVVNQVPSDLIWLSPERGQPIHPGQEVRFNVFDRTLEPGAWTLYYQEEMFPLESGLEAIFTVPEEWIDGTLRAVYTRDDVSIESSYPIEDLKGFRLISPPLGSSHLPGSSYQVQWVYRGSDGVESEGPMLNWSLVGFGETHLIQSNGWGIFPALQGEYLLQGRDYTGELLAEFPLNVQVEAEWTEVPKSEGVGSMWENNHLLGEQSNTGWRFGFDRDLLLHTGLGNFELEIIAEDVSPYTLGYLRLGDAMGNVFVSETGGRTVITIRFNSAEPWVRLSGDFEMDISRVRWRRINYRQSSVDYRVTPMIGGEE